MTPETRGLQDQPEPPVTAAPTLRDVILQAIKYGDHAPAAPVSWTRASGRTHEQMADAVLASVTSYFAAREAESAT